MTITSITVVNRQAAAVGGALLPAAIAIAAPYGTPGPLVSGTSSTPAVINTAQREYVVNEIHRAFAPGMRIRASVPGEINVFVEGLVDEYDGYILKMTPDFTGGAGTWSSWQFNVAGQPGPQGIQGVQGPIGPQGNIGLTGPQGIAGAGADYAMSNGKFTVTAASNALTIALKTLAGTDPTALNPVKINMNDSVTGQLQTIDITAATSIVIPTGALMGVTSSRAFRLWVLGTYDGSTFRLAVYNALTGFTSAPVLQRWAERNRAILAIDATADNGQTLYASAAIANCVVKALAVLEWSSAGLVVSGQWTITNLGTQLILGHGTAKPGDIVQSKTVTTSATTAATTVAAAISGFSISFLPTSPSSLIRVRIFGNFRHSSGAGAVVILVPQRDAGNLTYAQSGYLSMDTPGGIFPVTLIAYDMPNSSGLLTYTANIVMSGAGSTGAFNSIGGTCEMTIEEISA